MFLADSATPERSVVEAVWVALRARRGSDPATLREALAENPPERAIGSALKLLADAGHARQDRDEGYSPLDDADNLRIDWPRLERVRARERARLDDMLRYARSSTCRRGVILRYFSASANVCGRCDRCEALAEDALSPDEAKTVARKVLSLVARLKNRFGRKVVARLLAGVVTRDDKDRGLDALPTVGALKPWSVDDCAMAVDACLAHGLLDTLTDDGKYPKVALTKLGVEVLFDRQSVPLALARPKAEEPSSAPRARSRKKRGDDKVPVPAATAADPALLAALRAWRTARSKEERVPPYCIFHDRTLEAIASARPKDHLALLGVPGLGPKKAEKYGEHVLSLVNSAT
jgi:ATP-dependent DNA helicase RecQ